MSPWWELGIWLSLSLYLISWGATLSRNSPHLQEVLGARGLLGAWGLHTLLLGYGLAILASWPHTLVPDLLNLTAWGAVTGLILSGATRRQSMMQAIVRVFAVLLLGVSVAVSQYHLPGLGILEEESWPHHAFLIIHIVGFIAGYVLFGGACVASILVLYQEHLLKSKIALLFQRRFPSLGSLERMSHQATRLGFASLSIGLILGAILGGSVRSGEASVRLVLSLVSWMVYALLLINLQLHLTSRRWVTIWPIVGFLLILASLVLEIHHLVNPPLL